MENTGRQQQASYVVAIGLSADGLTTLRTLLEGLPASFPAPVLIVQHRAPTGHSVLAKLLGRRVALRKARR